MATALYLAACQPIDILSCAFGAQTARISCKQCGSHDEWKINSRLPPPEVIHKHFAQKGWSTSRKSICPLCLNKRKSKMSDIKPAVVLVSKGGEASDAARKAKRMVYQALEDYYDDQRKLYRDGKSDRSVADEIGVSEAFVKGIREADFGPLAEPSEVRELREQIGDLQSQIVKLEDRLKQLCLRNGWAIP